MEEVRRPCEHRGTPAVLVSKVFSAHGPIDFNICKECRRFWLERDGWQLSKRETVSILRNWPIEDGLSAAR